jgi:hypothetical protein
MTLQPIPSEFPFILGKFRFIFISVVRLENVVIHKLATFPSLSKPNPLFAPAPATLS